MSFIPARVFQALSLLPFLLLAGCAQPPQPPPTPQPPTATALPAATLPILPGTSQPTLTASPTQAISGAELFSKIGQSSDVLHLRCDPLEIIFTVAAKDPRVTGVAFFFRMKDKNTGLVNAWSNGDDMRAAGNGTFQFVFKARAIPDEGRYKNAWLQFQFAALNRAGESLGRSPIYADKVTYTTACP